MQNYLALKDFFFLRGFTLEFEAFSETNFGNYQVIFQNRTNKVRVTKDKGEFFVDFQSEGHLEWQDVIKILKNFGKFPQNHAEVFKSEHDLLNFIESTSFNKIITLYK